MPIPIEWLVGPVAALALALWVSNALWQSHKAADQRERDRADALEARLNRIADKLERSPKAEPPK